MKTMSRLLVGVVLLALAGSLHAAVSVSRTQGFNKSWQFINSGYEGIEPYPTGYYKDYNGDGLADYLIVQKSGSGDLRAFTINTAATGGDKTYSNKTAGRDFAATAGSSVPDRVFTPRSPASDLPDLVVYSNNSGGTNGSNFDTLTFRRLDKTNTAWPTEKSKTLTMPFKAPWAVVWPEYSYDSDDYPDFFVYNSIAPKDGRRFVLTLYNGRTFEQIWQKTLALHADDVYSEVGGYAYSYSNLVVNELPLLPVGRIGNGDFDNDGKPELVCYYNFGSVLTGMKYTNCITVLNSSGNPISPYGSSWTAMDPSSTKGSPLLWAARADYDKDGYRDVMFIYTYQTIPNATAVPAFTAYSLKKRSVLFKSTNSDLGDTDEERSMFNTIEPLGCPGNGCVDLSGDGKIDLAVFRNKNEAQPLAVGLFHGVGGAGRKIWLTGSSSTVTGYERVHMDANDFNYDGVYDFALVKPPTGPAAPTFKIANTAFQASGISIGKTVNYTSSVTGSIGTDQTFFASSTTIGSFGDMNGNSQRDTWAGLWWELVDEDQVAVKGGASLVVYNTPPPSSSSAASVFASVDITATNLDNWCPAPFIYNARIVDGYSFVDNDKDSVTDDVIVYYDQALLALNFKDKGIYAAAAQATTPNPADGGTVQAGKPLRWEAPDGEYAESSFQVYLGTSQTAVTNATRASAEYKGDIGFTAVWLPRPALTAGKTYYWRVDTVNAFGQVTKGKVWRIGVKAPTNAAGGDWLMYR
ncbi:MAG: hypothetical protein ABFD69_14450 [Candidatus Sumerlaeia bacterium]